MEVKLIKKKWYFIDGKKKTEVIKMEHEYLTTSYRKFISSPDKTENVEKVLRDEIIRRIQLREDNKKKGIKP